MVETVWTAEVLVDFWTAAALAVFAIAVGAASKFRGIPGSYALFGGGFGISIMFNEYAYAVSLANPDGHLAAQASWNAYAFGFGMSALISVAWLAGILLLWKAYGGRVGDWRVWVVAGIFGVIWAAGMADQLAEFWQDHPIAVAVAVVRMGVFMLIVGAMAMAPLVMAKARLETPMPGQAILAVAMSAYPLWWATDAIAFQIQDPGPTWGTFVLLAALLYALGTSIVGWLKVRQVEGAMSPIVLVIAFNLFFAGAVLKRLYAPDAFSAAGIARIFEILLVGYAVLRGRYLGFEARARWGLSKSTVAVVFIAVFFVVTEAAQAFFGERFRSEYLGIGAAGLLVLGIAPLQRWADGVAARAIPEGAVSRLDLFRATLGRYLSDGVFSVDEEQHLEHLAKELGIPVTQALQMQHEALDAAGLNPA